MDLRRPSTLKQAVAILKKGRWLSYRDRTNRSNIYRLNLEALKEVAEQNRAEDRRREARAGRACSPRFDQIGPTMARFDVTQSAVLAAEVQ